MAQEKLIKTKKTPDEQTLADAHDACEAAVNACNAVILRLKEQAVAAGGINAWYALLGTEANDYRNFAREAKAIVEKWSDMDANDLEA